MVKEEEVKKDERMCFYTDLHLEYRLQRVENVEREDDSLRFPFPPPSPSFSHFSYSMEIPNILSSCFLLSSVPTFLNTFLLYHHLLLLCVCFKRLVLETRIWRRRRRIAHHRNMRCVLPFFLFFSPFSYITSFFVWFRTAHSVPFDPSFPFHHPSKQRRSQYHNRDCYIEHFLLYWILGTFDRKMFVSVQHVLCEESFLMFHSSSMYTYIWYG